MKEMVHVFVYAVSGVVVEKEDLLSISCEGSYHPVTSVSLSLEEIILKYFQHTWVIDFCSTKKKGYL